MAFTLPNEWTPENPSTLSLSDFFSISELFGAPHHSGNIDCPICQLQDVAQHPTIALHSRILVLHYEHRAETPDKVGKFRLQIFDERRPILGHANIVQVLCMKSKQTQHKTEHSTVQQRSAEQSRAEPNKEGKCKTEVRSALLCPAGFALLWLAAFCSTQSQRRRRRTVEHQERWGPRVTRAPDDTGVAT
jgi:hypothetical protein